MNRRSGVKMFLSVITAPLVLAQLIYFLTVRCHVNLIRFFFVQKKKLKNPPKNINLIRHAYSRYKHVCANTIGVVNVHIFNTQWETLILLVKIRSASPIRRDNAYL
jgi:hypothetical protein